MSRVTRHLGLFAALALLVFVAIRPVRRAAAFEDVRSAAVADVERFRADASRLLSEGEMPSSDSFFAGEGYSIEWELLGFVETAEGAAPTDIPADEVAVVDSLPPVLIEAVRPAGLIRVHTSIPGLLGSLLEAYRDQGGFVSDSTLSLVVGLTDS